MKLNVGFLIRVCLPICLADADAQLNRKKAGGFRGQKFSEGYVLLGNVGYKD